MKKQLLVPILLLGLLDSYMQAVGVKDLIEAVHHRDQEHIFYVLDQYKNIQDQDYVQDLEKLLASGVSLSDKLYDEDNENFSLGLLLFWKALEDKKYNIAQFLLNHGMNVDQEIEDGATALNILAENGDLEGVRFLLDNGADIMAKDNDGKTAFDNIKNRTQAEDEDDAILLIKEYAPWFSDIIMNEDYSREQLLKIYQEIMSEERLRNILNRFAEDIKKQEVRSLLEYHLKKQ